MTKSIHYGISCAILRQDSEPTRFEDFCADLLTDVEGGTPIVTTSRSWDSGRDGRSVGPGPRIVLCATLMSSVDEKAKSDVTKLIKAKTKADKLYFCTSQPVSETKLNECAASVADLAGDEITIETLSGPQLADLSRAYPKSLTLHYRAEIDECLAAFTSDDRDEDSRRKSLLLALATCGHTNSGAIRDACYQASILSVLADEIPRTRNEVSKSLGDRLHISHPIPPLVVGYHLDSLSEQGLVQVTPEDQKFVITADGNDAVEENENKAVVNLGEGRDAVRSALEESTGIPFLA